MSEIAVGCEEGAKDVGHRDGDDAVDEQSEYLGGFCYMVVIHQSHKGLAQPGAGDGCCGRKDYHKAEDQTGNGGDLLLVVFLGKPRVDRQQRYADEIGYHGEGVEEAEGSCIDACLKVSVGKEALQQHGVESVVAGHQEHQQGKGSALFEDGKGEGAAEGEALQARFAQKGCKGHKGGNHIGRSLGVDKPFYTEDPSMGHPEQTPADGNHQQTVQNG